MSEENKIGYYAVIPSTILFNNDLKPNEKLLYAVITVLSNKESYCYASNAYLGKLFNVIPHTISIWVSNLKNKGFLYVDIITDEKGEVIQRRIYPNDTPYVINKTGGMFQKGQYNIISNNKIDRLFCYIIDKEKKIPEEFVNVEYNEIISALKRYEMLYTKATIQYISIENLNRIKDITYIIALMVKNRLFHLSNKVSRDKLIQMYNECKNRKNQYKGTDNQIENFINYYYKSIENELTKDASIPSFLCQIIVK